MKEERKLTIKHLAPYLPYELKFTDGYTKSIVSFSTYSVYSSGEFDKHCIDKILNDEYIKPILRPLSDLDIGILHEFNFLYAPDVADYIDLYSYGFMMYCFKNHFDVFRLIDKGLAININTLK